MFASLSIVARPRGTRAASWPILFCWLWMAALGTCQPLRADEEQASEPSPLATYSEAFQSATESGKDLLVYFRESASPTTAQQEFEQKTLKDAKVRELLDERFVLVRLTKGQAVEYRTTEVRTKYVRQRFRSVQQTYNQTVVKPLLEDQSNAVGFCVVRVTGDAPVDGTQLLAWFPFEATQLPPQVFKRDPAFQPWTTAIFRQIIATPTAGPEEYLTSLSKQQPLQSAAVSVALTDSVPTLNNIQYDYDHSMANLESRSVNTKIHLAHNNQLALVGDPVDVRVDVYSLKDSKSPVKFAYLKLDTSDQWQDFRVEGLEPETPYKFEIHFYWPAGAHPLIGKAATSFLGVTCGQTRLSKARAKVAMSALGELNDWQRGQNNRKGYVIGAWCERFYFWNIASHVLPPYRTGYDPGIFSRNGALISGAIAKKAVTHENAMGDHVRVPGHGFMVLCYDKHLDQVWCIEGNYGNRVEMTKRSPSGSWSLGRLTEEMLLPEDGA